jgi:hypothetical protein
MLAADCCEEISGLEPIRRSDPDLPYPVMSIYFLISRQEMVSSIYKTQSGQRAVGGRQTLPRAYLLSTFLPLSVLLANQTDLHPYAI